MQLIADSGSTKTSWGLAGKGSFPQYFQTEGMNPFFQSETTLQQIVANLKQTALKDRTIDHVFFYGAGCAFPEQIEKIRQIFLTVWPEAEVFVASDLLGAARALCGNQAGIACILGTGSNSCLYNGKEICEHISPLGFILGDEGSGAVLGKRLVGDCLKGLLPPDLTTRFMEEYQLTPQLLLDRVYRGPLPNRFLASFVPFLAQHLHRTEIRQIVLLCFRDFFLRNIKSYTGYRELPIHFTGSVAYYFQEILAEAAQSEGLQLGNIQKEPMEGLLRYHATHSSEISAYDIQKNN